MAIESYNPATGEKIAEYHEMDSAEVAAILTKADGVFHEWRTTSFAERTKLMKRAGEILRSRSAEYGRLMTDEMGKTLSQGRAEAEKCAWVCDYYAENAEKFLAEEVVVTDATRS